MLNNIANQTSPAKPDDHVPQPSESASASHINQAIFADPADFLTTLRSAVIKAHPHTATDVGLSDLELFASTGDNPRERAAAAVAAAHYDKLIHLPCISSFLGPREVEGSGLSTERIDGLL